MLKQVYEIDINGYTKEIYVKDFDERGNCKEELAENFVTKDIPQGLYRAKWNGEAWEESATQEYIDSLKAQAVPQEPSLEERIQALEVMELERILGGEFW